MRAGLHLCHADAVRVCTLAGTYCAGVLCASSLVEERSHTGELVFTGTYGDEDTVGEGHTAMPDGGEMQGEMRHGTYHGQATYTYPQLAEQTLRITLRGMWCEGEMQEARAFHGDEEMTQPDEQDATNTRRSATHQQSHTSHIYRYDPGTETCISTQPMVSIACCDGCGVCMYVSSCSCLI